MAPDTFTLHNLLDGEQRTLPVGHRPDIREVILPAMIRAQRAGKAYRYDSGLAVTVDLSKSGHGVALLTFTAAEDMRVGDYPILKGACIYTMVACISPRLAADAWRTATSLFWQRGLEAESRGEGSLMAPPGEMPTLMPWVVGFPWGPVGRLTPKGASILQGHVFGVAAALVARCLDVYIPDSEIARTSPYRQ